MKICITSYKPELSSDIDQRFGRCAHFIIYDIDTDKFEAVENEFVNSRGGAGIGAAQKIINLDATVVITGAVGPKAMDVLQGGNIEVITEKSGPVSKAIEEFKKSKSG